MEGFLLSAKSSLFFICLILLADNCAVGIKWLALGRDQITWDSRTRHIQCRATRRTYGLPRGQEKLCRSSLEVMPHISTAASQALETCQDLFQTRRWNCSTALLAPSYAPDLTTGTREQGFVYGISSAALVSILSKACASGSFFNCSCAAHPKDSPNGNFKWGGCGDNVRWAMQFAKQFTDPAEKKILRGKSAPKTKRGSAPPNPDLSVVFLTTDGTNKLQSKVKLASVNLHNNKAGRKLVEMSLKTQCKCHGVSGSCSIKICWKGLPPFYEIGERLYAKYLSSLEVTVNKIGVNRRLEPKRQEARIPRDDDLVFVTKSPDYCLRDDRTGSLGTRGRYCNASIRFDFDSCELMCCGRGYVTITVQTVERCRCKFHWCCKVVCKKCISWVDKHICN